MKTLRHIRPLSQGKRGSALLLAIIVVAVLGVMAANQIRSALTGTRLAESMLLQNSLLNIAEAGAEFALHARNTDDWSNWKSVQNGSADLHTSQPIALGNGVEGEYTVLIQDRTSPKPRIYVESRIYRPGHSTPLTRQITVGLGARSLFDMQLFSREEFGVKGGANLFIYSFRSDELLKAMESAEFLSGTFPTDFLSLLNSSTFTALFGSFIRDNGSIGSLLVDLNAVDIGQADVYGRVATGGEMPKYHDNNAKIYGSDTPSGTHIDLDRIALDFFANLDPVDEPIYSIGVNYALPEPVDVGKALGSDDDGLAETVVTKLRGRSGNNNNNNNNNNSSGATAVVIGDPSGEVEVYDLSDLKLDGDIYINGPVVLISRGDMVIGNNHIYITEHGSAEVYFAGDFTVSGNGTVNNATQLARNFALFGIHEEEGKHSVTLNGNAAMSAAIYAPNADVVLNGGGSRGSFIGSVVGKTITINGGNLHLLYDETLADDFVMGSLGMEDWRELHRPEDRFNFAAVR